MAIEIYPTCDVHLCLDYLDDFGLSMSMPIILREPSNPSNNIGSFTTGTRYLDFNPSIVQVTERGTPFPHILLTPIALGESIGRIQHTVLNTAGSIDKVHEILIRVRVHQSIDDYWIGNEKISIHQDREDYVISVFAKFSDGTYGDITWHPYLNFSIHNASDTTFLEVDNLHDKGRLKGLSFNPSDIRVDLSISGFPDLRHVNVKVVGSIDTLSVLRCIHGNSIVNGRRNILFLPEGFTDVQKPIFDQLAYLLKERLLNSPHNSPFNLLRNDLNIWTAFLPSGEEGITIGPMAQLDAPNTGGNVDIAPRNYMPEEPVNSTGHKNYSLFDLIRFTGFPNDHFNPAPANITEARISWNSLSGFDGNCLVEDIFSLYKQLEPADNQRFFQTVDCRFGFIAGRRQGERTSVEILSTDPVSLNEWYIPQGMEDGFDIDKRRQGNEWRSTPALLDFLYRYISFLDVNPSYHDSTLNADIGKTWVIGEGSDYSLVVYIMNDNLGRSLHSGLYSTINIRSINVGSFGLENIPFLSHPHKIMHFPSPMALSIDIPLIEGIDINNTSSILAHELGHAFSLADEYEENLGALGEDDIDAQTSIDRYPNLVHHFWIDVPSDSAHQEINVARVPWTHWFRVSSASRTTADATLIGGRVHLSIDLNQTNRWTVSKIDSLNVYLRTSSINVFHPIDESRFTQIGPLRIEEINSSGELVLSFVDGAPTAIPPLLIGSVLYGAKQDQEANLDYGPEQRVMSEPVRHYFEESKIPFANNTDPNISGEAVGFPSNDVTILEDTWFEEYTIGVYEGGGLYNANVYRPSGYCKMRSHYGDARSRQRYPTFCYVCKYVIINEVNPERLGLLDSEYPG